MRLLTFSQASGEMKTGVSVTDTPVVIPVLWILLNRLSILATFQPLQGNLFSVLP